MAKYDEYKSLCRQAVDAALDTLYSGGENAVVDAVETAIRILEDNPLTNAGLGSNMTREGTVECDASIMDSKGAAFGAVGAVPGVKNCISAARRVLENGRMEGRCGLVPPLLVCGDGAVELADSEGRDVNLVTHKQRVKFEQYSRMVEHCYDEWQQDTVGAVCIDQQGRVASGVSSGGIWLKRPGRVGEAAVYGAGCWAQKMKSTSIGVSLTGTGEQIMKTFAAKSISDILKRNVLHEHELAVWLRDEFLDSESLRMYNNKYIGFIAICQDDDNGLKLFYGHTTPSMILAHKGHGPSLKKDTRLVNAKFCFSKLEKGRSKLFSAPIL